MKTSGKLIPQLRFSEFKENWKIEELDDYINLLSGYAFKGDDISDVNNGIPLLRGINITEGKIRHSKDIDRYYNQKITGLEKYLLEEDDLVLGMDGSKVGKNVSLISKEDAGSLLIQRVARVRAKFTSDIRFIYLNIFSERFHKYVDKVNTSSGIPHISSKQIKEFSIGFPSLPEQQKIASFLTDVDDKITKLTKKKALLEKYKKGVLQKIFNQELRFKPDVIVRNEAISSKEVVFPKWEEKKLGDITSLLKDGSHGSHKDAVSSYFLLSAKNIRNGRINIDDSDRKISKKDYQAIYKNYTLKKDDILLSIVGTIGRVAIFRNEINIAFQRSVAFFRFNEQHAEFVFHLMSGNAFQKELKKRQVVSAQPGIYLGDLAKIPLKIPSLQEQTKIANFLSDIDVKIEALNNKIENSKIFKKGLLQQMFV